MKKEWIALATASLLLPCVAQADAAADMQALADKNGCFACHGMQSKVVGPGFAEVAAKYKGDGQAAERLGRKIRDGGKGVWGPVPMPSHGNLGEADARKLAEWVLSAG
ncbi:Cytochrome c-552 [Cupriavidus yeoncheonensis]|uniref:Cytochrome c-552 n=1 Tax=Cupriavidus yeoncheonensis TaxID=1462994 RepID=A0A916IR41_9BURK|nr:c-type cytochrome [Cupriavidus yeoncheonensis]CAG2127333.1 Cytochrome c-552 [Cupriavidus yeoncheonensis]